MGLSLPFLNESSTLDDTTQNVDLFQHLQIKHGDYQQSTKFICPICAAMATGEPNVVTDDPISHIANDHQHSQENTSSSPGRGTSTYSRQSPSTSDYDFGAGGRGDFRRGPLRTPGRRGGIGKEGRTVSQHFLVDPLSGMFTVGGANNPIADLLAQLSTVRRLAAPHTNNSLLPCSNTISLQTHTSQQYEREHLRTSGRSHYHPQHSTSNNLVVSVESDLFDSLFTSTLFIDPSTSSPNNHQTWAQIVAQQQPQSFFTAKTPGTTKAEPDLSLLRRMCNESSSLTQKNATVKQQQKHKNDFVHSFILSSFAYSIDDSDK